MRSAATNLGICFLALSLACTVPSLLAKKKERATDPSRSENGLSERKRAVHALNRLTFGPRPGDLQQVMALGVDRWIDLQLHPEQIKGPTLESRLAPFRTLHMNSKEIAEEFPDGEMVKQVMEGKKPLPSDPARRAVFNVQIARLEEKQERKEGNANRGAASSTSSAQSNSMAETASNAASDGDVMKAAPGTVKSSSADTPRAPTVEDAAAPRRDERFEAELKMQQLVDLPAGQRYKSVLAMAISEQLAVADSLRGGKAQEFLAGMDPEQKETLLAFNNPPGVVIDELVQAKLLRAIYSERQLEEVMTDFWFNHFNVFVGKGADRLLISNYEQEVIRPHALGKFEDLLVATAKSPAMLFYLDNWLSVGPDSAQALGLPARPGPRGRRPRLPRPNLKRSQNSGLNENYGRELLELHTLSVSGGYSQRDVTETAKVFTGWTIDRPNLGGGFKFDPRMHEPGPKFVLGHRIKPKGEGEALELMHRLATSPQTAHFISLKLAQRFVADDPPEALVDRMAKTFLHKKGNIREVLTTLFRSPEFWADEAYRSKLKTPLEFVASAIRATGADVEDAMPLARQLNNMGMPLYGAQPPTGYSMKAGAWVSSSALLNRMNFALALTAGKIKGIKVDSAQLAGGSMPPMDVALALPLLESRMLAGDVTKQTHDSIASHIEEAAKNASPSGQERKGRQNKNASQRKLGDAGRPADVNTIAGLLLGSPEFQRR